MFATMPWDLLQIGPESRQSKIKCKYTSCINQGYNQVQWIVLSTSLPIPPEIKWILRCDIFKVKKEEISGEDYQSLY